MNVRGAVALTVFVLCAGREAHARNLIVPIVTNAPGAGARRYETTLTLHNHSSVAQGVRLTFRNSGAPAPPAVTALSLAPGGWRKFPDVLLVFGIASGFGSLEVESGAEVDTRVVLRSETDALPIPPFVLSDAIARGENARVDQVSFGGSSEFRYNVIVQEVVGEGASVRLRLLSPRGELAERTLALEPLEHRLYTAADLFPHVTTEHAIVEATVDSGLGRIIMLGSRIRQRDSSSTLFKQVPGQRRNKEIPTLEFGIYAVAGLLLAFAGARRLPQLAFGSRKRGPP